MKYLKKHLSLALALVLCLSLAACGKSSEDYVESNEDYGDDGSDYNLYGVPDSFEGLVKDSEQMANLYLYGGAWTGGKWNRSGRTYISTRRNRRGGKWDDRCDGRRNCGTGACVRSTEQRFPDRDCRRKRSSIRHGDGRSWLYS